jgi:hypothetical protein
VPEPKNYPRPYEIFESRTEEPEEEFDESAIAEGQDFGSDDLDEGDRDGNGS